MAAFVAVVPRTAQLDRAEHGVERLGAVGHEVGLMSATAVDVGASIAAVRGQDLLEQPGSRRVQGLAHRHLHSPEHVVAAAGIGERRSGRLGEGGYLGGDLCLEVREEPPFSAPLTASARSPAGARTGRASQIASFTSTISATVEVKRL